MGRGGKMTDADYFWRERIDKNVSLKTDRQLKLITDPEEFKRYVKAHYLQGTARPNDKPSGQKRADKFFWDTVLESRQCQEYLVGNKARSRAKMVRVDKADVLNRKVSNIYANRGIAIAYKTRDVNLEKSKTYYLYKTKTGRNVYADIKTGRFTKPPEGYHVKYVYKNS